GWPRPPYQRRAKDAHRWLRGFRKENPALYQEFMALRDENPEVFRERLADLLERKRMQDCLTNFPEFNNCYLSLPEEEQIRIAVTCFAPPPGFSRDGPPPCERDNHPPMQRTKNRKAFHALVNKYRATDDPESRKALRAELLTLIGQRYDEHTEERREHLNQLAAQLELFHKRLDERIANRDRTIQQQFERLTSDRPME
ncbi:MAG: hypothetical protein PHG65_12555, partial [Kiritimatiellae bacterium]|nr:hypothetical protein [Kiritimatiellia bacterium]